tara:strand:+ start:397 stop:906 length:510 start_codon:yes stop_codon:yes gene_type:complete
MSPYIKPLRGTDVKEASSIPIRIKPSNVSLQSARSRKSSPKHRSKDDDFQGVYIISVAARILRTHPQTLRKYERIGLVRPSRTLGMLRLYSKEDIDKLRLIRYLESELGLNLAGVEVVLKLLSSLQQVSTLLENIAENDALGEIIGEELQKILNSLVPNVRTISKDIHE